MALFRRERETKNAPIPAQETGDEASCSKKIRSNVSPVTCEKYITCQKDKPYPKNQRKNGALVQCMTLDSSQSLLSAAEAKSDERVLLDITGTSLTTIEAKYHKSSHRDYTR